MQQNFPSEPVVDNAFLAIHSTYKTYRTSARTPSVAALRGVDLVVEQGNFAAILGPSGCGKSTLLKIIAGIDRQDAGEVWLDGQQLSGSDTHLAPERRDIGIVPQEGALFPHMNVADNVGFGLHSWRSNLLSPTSRSRKRERVQQLLDLVGLGDHAKRRPDELSGGQQQRVALARALAPSPKLVLLDEPFSALDAGLREELRIEVRELLKMTNTTAILVTHDQEEALSLADQVAVMRDGVVVQAGSPVEIYTRPADMNIAQFVGDAVLLPAFYDPGTGSAAACALGRVRVCENCRYLGRGPCTVMLRPEQVVLDPAGVLARVTGFTFYGHGGKLTLALGQDGSGANVTARIGDGPIPKVGDVVRVRVAGDAVAYAHNGVTNHSNDFMGITEQQFDFANTVIQSTDRV